MFFKIPDHKRGDTWQGINKLTLKINGSVVNLSGADVKMEFREKIDSPVLLTFSTANSAITLTNPLSGELKIKEKTIEIPYGNYIYDLQVNFPDETVLTFLEGTWKIIADVTY